MRAAVHWRRVFTAEKRSVFEEIINKSAPEILIKRYQLEHGSGFE